MVLELVIQTLNDPSKRDEYVGVLKKAWKTAAFAGSHEGKVLRCIEDPAKLTWYVLWDSKETHINHQTTEVYKTFRAATAPYMAGPSTVNHYEMEDLT